MISELSGLAVSSPILSYEEYIPYILKLVDNDRTTGTNQSLSLIDYTALNLKRMERIKKTFKFIREPNGRARLAFPQQWILITEAWCGDSAQSLPVIGEYANKLKNDVSLKIILRDANPTWIEKYHTNGTRSIPKLISFDLLGNELFTWGPRPAAAQQMFYKWKNKPDGKSWDAFETELHTWYTKDRTQATQHEIQRLLNKYEK